MDDEIVYSYSKEQLEQNERVREAQDHSPQYYFNCAYLLLAFALIINILPMFMGR